MSTEDQKTILLVEDEVLIAMMEQQILQKFGYRVVATMTGEDAVGTVEKTPGIDLVLMDIDLGRGISGPEAAVQILKERDIPIVFLTSHSEREMVETVRGITRYGYVIKNSGDFVLHSSIEMAFELFDSQRQLTNELSARRQAEETLRVSQQITEGIINAIPSSVFWKDRNLVFQGCNMAFARDAGFADPKDVIGKDDFKMVWKDQAELYRSDDLQIIESGSSKVLIEEPQTTPEGNTITLLTSKIPLRNLDGEISGVLGAYIDITERKRIEEDLRTHQVELKMQNEEFCRKQEELEALCAKYFNFYDLAPAGYLTFGRDGMILEANLTAAVLLGVMRDALPGKPVTRFILNDDQDVFYLYRKQLFERLRRVQGKPVLPEECELRMRRTDGTTFPASLHAVVTQDDGDAPMCRVVILNHEKDHLE